MVVHQYTFLHTLIYTDTRYLGVHTNLKAVCNCISRYTHLIWVGGREIMSVVVGRRDGQGRRGPVGSFEVLWTGRVGDRESRRRRTDGRVGGRYPRVSQCVFLCVCVVTSQPGTREPRDSHWRYNGRDHSVWKRGRWRSGDGVLNTASNRTLGH